MDVDTPPAERVRITDIDISIGALMTLMLKACIAVIPVAFVLAIATVVIGALLGGLTGIR